MTREVDIKRGRRILLLMQVFSTFAFSILFGTLVLYATDKLQLSGKMATAITGSFLAFNYALHVLGGYMGGRLISYRSLFLLGMCLQAVGISVISLPNFYALIWGLAIFLSGAGLNVICINCMLTQLFSPTDKRRESAFLWNYSGMNLGFLIGFTISGYFQIIQNYRTLFLIGSLGNIFAIILTLLNWKILADKETSFVALDSKAKRIKTMLSCLLALALAVSLSWLLEHAGISNALILVLGLVVAFSIAILALKEKTSENRSKMWAFLILALASLVFWTLYQMGPMGLILFYERNVEHQIFGLTIAPQWMFNINSFLIIIGGPLISYFNQHFRKKGKAVSLPFQFTSSLLLIGVGFLLLPLGIFFANTKGISSMTWILCYYLFQSIAELFISPIGYAMVGQLIPVRLQSFAMGTWMMITGVAAVLSNYFSQFALGQEKSTNPLLTNASFSRTFFLLAALSIAGAIILFFFRNFLHKLIQEKELSRQDIEPAPPPL